MTETTNTRYQVNPENAFLYKSDLIEKLNNALDEKISKVKSTHKYIIGDPYKKISSEKSRDKLETEIRRKYSEKKFSNDYWDFISTYQKSALSVFRIQNSEFNPYAIHEFLHCHWINGKGLIFTDHENENTYYKHFSCCNPACLECEQKRRKRVAMDRIADLKAVVEGQKEGFPGFLSLDFTLPEKYQELPLENPEIEKNLIKGIDKYVKDLFGKKTRSNISTIINIHPTGSNDIMKNRWHCHCLIIPAEITTKATAKKGEQPGKFNWLEPIKHFQTPGHTSKEWFFSLEKLKSHWAGIAGNAMETIIEKDEINQPEIEWIPFDRNTRYWAGSRGDHEENFWRKIHHKLNYDGRSFAKDFKDAVVRSRPKDSRIIIKSSFILNEIEYGFWQDLHAWDFVNRFKFVRKKNRILTRGWLHRKKLHQESGALTLIYEEEKQPEKPNIVTLPAQADVNTRIEKVFNPKTGKFTTEIERFWSWEDPITGHFFDSIPEEKLKKWIWDT